MKDVKTETTFFYIKDERVSGDVSLFSKPSRERKRERKTFMYFYEQTQMGLIAFAVPVSVQTQESTTAESRKSNMQIRHRRQDVAKEGLFAFPSHLTETRRDPPPPWRGNAD